MINLCFIPFIFKNFIYMKIFITIFNIIIFALSPASALTEDAQRGPVDSAQLPAGTKANPPWGWSDFCRRYPGECVNQTLAPETTRLTPKLWTLLNKVNRDVNASVTAITDQEHWGLPEHWDYPDDGKGDCEDFSLLKRKILIKAGIAIENLSLAVVRDTTDNGHAVLLVRTDRGVLVLDNQTNLIKTWNQTEYRFVKQQSRTNPARWERLDTADEDSLTGY